VLATCPPQALRRRNPRWESPVPRRFRQAHRKHARDPDPFDGAQGHPERLDWARRSPIEGWACRTASRLLHRSPQGVLVCEQGRGSLHRCGQVALRRQRRMGLEPVETAATARRPPRFAAFGLPW